MQYNTSMMSIARCGSPCVSAASKNAANCTRQHNCKSTTAKITIIQFIFTLTTCPSTKQVHSHISKINTKGIV